MCVCVLISFLLFEGVAVVEDAAEEDAVEAAVAVK